MSAKHASPGPQWLSTNAAEHDVLQLLLSDVASKEDPRRSDATVETGDAPGTEAMMQLHVPSPRGGVLIHPLGRVPENEPFGSQYPPTHAGMGSEAHVQDVPMILRPFTL